MNLKSYISKNDRVCILPFSFFDDTKMSRIGTNNMDLEWEYGIEAIKMCSIDMEFRVVI